MWIDFLAKLETSILNKNTHAIFRLSPFMPMPLEFYRHDDPFFPYSRAVIQHTSELVCGYLFDMSAYLSMGAAGAVALERSISVVPDDMPILLSGDFSGTGWSAMADKTAFAIDALIVADSLSHYLENPPYAAFLKSNNDAPVPEQGGLYLPAAQQLMLYTQDKSLLHLTIASDTDIIRDANYIDTLRAHLRKQEQ